MTTEIFLFPGEKYKYNFSFLKTNAFSYRNGSLFVIRPGALKVDSESQKVVLDDLDSFKQVGKAYYPRENDFVIGTIVSRTADFYKLDINANFLAILPSTSFEGATKKSKPDLKVGQEVFSRVEKTSLHEGAQLSCIALNGDKKNWSSGEAFFGQLTEGTTVEWPISKTYELYDQENWLLNKIFDYTDFEVVTGVNGRVFLKAKDIVKLTKIRFLFEASLDKTEDEMAKIIHKMLAE